jgi:hypothetical protein
MKRTHEACRQTQLTPVPDAKHSPAPQNCTNQARCTHLPLQLWKWCCWPSVCVQRWMMGVGWQHAASGSCAAPGLIKPACQMASQPSIAGRRQAIRMVRVGLVTLRVMLTVQRMRYSPVLVQAILASSSSSSKRQTTPRRFPVPRHRCVPPWRTHSASIRQVAATATTARARLVRSPCLQQPSRVGL